MHGRIVIMVHSKYPHYMYLHVHYHDGARQISKQETTEQFPLKSIVIYHLNEQTVL